MAAQAKQKAVPETNKYMITNTRQTAPPTSSQQGGMKSTKFATGHASSLNPSKPQSATPPHAMIAEKAYAIWLAHGQIAGRAEEHWYEAERQLRQG